MNHSINKRILSVLLILTVLSVALLLAACQTLPQTPDDGTPDADDTQESCAHTLLVDSAVAPTCTEEGKSEGKHCVDCGKVIEAQATIPATGHTEIKIAAKAPTCTEAGRSEGSKCSICDTVLREPETVPATGHTEASRPGKAASCVLQGLSEGKYCTTCGTVTQRQHTIPPTGHQIVVVPGTPHDLVTDGMTDKKYCSICGTVTQKQTYIKAPHPDGVIFRADLTGDGEQEYIVMDRGGEKPALNVYDGKTEKALYSRAFTEDTRPGGLALLPGYGEHGPCFLLWTAEEVLTGDDADWRELRTAYEIFTVSAAGWETYIAHKGGNYPTTTDQIYELHKPQILATQTELHALFEGATMLVDNSTGQLLWGDPKAPVAPRWEYQYATYTPPPTAKDMIAINGTVMQELDRFAAHIYGEMIMTGTGAASGQVDMEMVIQDMQLWVEQTLGEGRRMYSISTVGDARYFTTMVGSTCYYDFGNGEKYMIVLTPEQYKEVFGSEAGGSGSFDEGPSSFRRMKITAGKGEALWTLTMTDPTDEFRQMIADSLAEQMGEDADYLQDLEITLVLEVDAQERTVSQAMYFSATMDMTAMVGVHAGVVIEATYRTDFDYSGEEMTITVPEDYAEYEAYTYDDFFEIGEQESMSLLLPLGDLNGDGVEDLLHITENMEVPPYRPQLDIRVYDPSSGDFIHQTHVALTSDSAQGLYLYHDDGGMPHLLRYEFIRGAEDPETVGRMQYVLYRMQPTVDGVTAPEVIKEKVVSLPALSEAVDVADALAIYQAFIDELNGYLQGAAPVADTSLGEPQLLPEEGIIGRVDPIWLYADVLGGIELPEGFTYERVTVEVTSPTLNVRSEPISGSMANIIYQAEQGEFFVCIATDGEWRMVLLDGGYAFVLAKYTPAVVQGGE